MIGAIIAKKSVKAGYDALNERNIDKFMKVWADQSEWIYPDNLSVSGKFSGKENVRKWFENMKEQFPQMVFTIKHMGVGNIFALSGNNVVSCNWEMEVTNKSGNKSQKRGVTVLTIKGGKVVRGEDFLSTSSLEHAKIWGE
jgi:ketosteroid isomerase-like protein